jgi:N-acetylated-alpha-linked acidic dipeptidase
MRRGIVIATMVITAIASGTRAADDEPLYGFTTATSNIEREWEKRFSAIPNPQIMRDAMQRLSARPHHVGSAHDTDNAEWILERFKSWGLEAHIEQYDILFPTPKARLVELVEPVRYVAKLQEPVVASDPTSGQQSEQLPSYHAYSIDGDVIAPLVYVNYGIPEDYQILDRLGVSVKGAIVIARYGRSWRGIKPKVAAEHGALGCIIYSDPRDDGYYNGETFPNGPMRNENGVQRGSVADMPSFPGDPLTPGVAAKGDVKRLAIKDSPTVTKIPVLPISYGDAKPLLTALKGPIAPEEFRGALPITYRLGPGPAKVHLKVQSNWDIKPIRNVIANIPGAQSPDQWIIRGNHHDAWVNGAVDPVSGLVALLEEARSLSELSKHGWKPKRTIIFCAWDGEEPGLIGSTEWCEDHATELAAHAALYVNSDSNGRGFLSVEGSHALEKFANGVARDVVDPEKNISVALRLKAQRLTSGNADVIKDVRKRADLRIGALGSGSDYTAFIDHLGIASLNVGFGGEDRGGVYHSIYDDFFWYSHFSDNDFVYGRALSQTAGTMLMRFADADVLPYDFEDFADTMHRYVDDVKKLLSGKQEEIRERNEAIDQGLFDAASDPRNPLLAPAKQAVPPFMNFAPLDNALATLDKSAGQYSKAIASFARKNIAANGQKLTALNARLIQTERLLTSHDGLPRRPWYKHLIYAPGFYTGYGVKTLPGIREGIEEQRYSEAELEITKVAQALSNYAASIDRVAEELERN